jgi:hypothetical protein
VESEAWEDGESGLGIANFRSRGAAVSVATGGSVISPYCKVLVSYLARNYIAIPHPENSQSRIGGTPIV